VAASTVGKQAFIGANALVQGSKVGDGASVGLGAKVAAGCDLGAACALAAGSVLPKGTNVPAGQLWAGAPAKYVRALTPEESAGHAQMLQVTSELAALHMDECWKDAALVEQEHEDYKRERTRTPEYAASLREDPGWTPLPTLGQHLEQMGMFEMKHAPPRHSNPADARPPGPARRAC
jgi:hypothetical protein